MSAARPDWETRFTVLSYAFLAAQLALLVAGLFWGQGWMVAAFVAMLATVASVVLSCVAGALARGNAEIDRATKGIGGQR